MDLLRDQPVSKDFHALLPQANRSRGNHLYYLGKLELDLGNGQTIMPSGFFFCISCFSHVLVLSCSTRYNLYTTHGLLEPRIHIQEFCWLTYPHPSPWKKIFFCFTLSVVKVFRVTRLAQLMLQAWTPIQNNHCSHGDRVFSLAVSKLRLISGTWEQGPNTVLLPKSWKTPQKGSLGLYSWQ